MKSVKVKHDSIIEKFNKMLDLNKKIKLDYDVELCCITNFDYESYL